MTSLERVLDQLSHVDLDLEGALRDLDGLEGDLRRAEGVDGPSEGWLEADADPAPAVKRDLAREQLWGALTRLKVGLNELGQAVVLSGRAAGRRESR